MANGMTIDQPSWQQGFEDGVRRLSAKCPPDADAFSYSTGYLDGLNDRQEQSSETPPPSDTPPPADAPAPAAAPRPWWRRLVG
jgi:hypothetical protein